MKENYAKESALITSLLSDLSTTEALAAIAILPGVEANITALTAAQTTFDTGFVAYEETKAHESDYENATTVKGEVLNMINEKLTVYLYAMTLAFPDTYKDFAAATGQIIDDNNIKVKKRSKKTEE